MGDNHPVLNRRQRIKQASQRLVQGRFVDQLARPYYVSTPLPFFPDALVPTSNKKGSDVRHAAPK
jgi:hypothetical protein